MKNQRAEEEACCLTRMKCIAALTGYFLLNTLCALGQSPSPTPQTETVPTATEATTNQRPIPPASKAEANSAKSEATPAAKAATVRLGSPQLPPEKAQPVRITRFNEPLAIDGRLDDAVWNQAAVLKDFYQVDPGDNIAPSQPTQVLLGYDAKNLYIGFRAHDQKGRVVANVARRDAVFDDDNITIMLDTYNDARRAYIFVFNPLGVQADGIHTEGRGDDYTVDVVMTSKGMVTEEGYTIEVAIPFKSLRYQAGKDRLWGVHVFRRIKRLNNEQSSWMPIARDNSGLLNQEGHIVGLENIASERTLELIPSLTVSESGRRVRPFSTNAPASLQTSGRIVNEPIKLDPGLTAKLGITPTVTLDLALNPDFAQVEADVPVITANQRFPIFFAEKRPFFLEGIDIFQTPLTPVHMRAIIDPDVAVKLSGKQGRYTFGLLLASDNAPGSFIGDERLDERNFRFLDKNAYIGILRLKRNIGKESTLGMIATSYSFIERHNHLGGFDGRFRLNKQSTFDFQVLGTTSRRFFFDPQQGKSIYGTGNGVGYSFTLDNSGRHFGYTLSGFGRTKNYRADLGFTLRTNTNQQQLNLRYNSEPNPEGKIISYRLSNVATANYDWQGRSQEMRNETQLFLNFKWQGFFQTGFLQLYERLVEEEFGPVRTPTRAGTFAGDDSERSSREKTIYAFAQVTPKPKYTVFFFALHTIGAFDFDFGAGPRFPRVSPGALAVQSDPLCTVQPANPSCFARLDPGPGGQRHYEFTFIYQPTAALRMSFNYNKTRLTRYDTGRVAFDENLSILRATYQFTRFTFARARLDHSSIASRLRGQFILGWTPNPGTSFYIGYNNEHSFNGFSPFTGDPERGFRQNNRTFFIKMSYLFRRSF